MIFFSYIDGYIVYYNFTNEQIFGFSITKHIQQAVVGSERYLSNGRTLFVE